ncbi:MAG: dephospho-CoA kinase [Lachnospiraceae bacterium]|nr:dephospho-CoA kinase [Lachnospiraceae bacterium]
MKIIGITGGVGAGKTEVMKILKEIPGAFILIADEAAHEVEKKGQECYERLVGLLSEDILSEDGEIDKSRMASKIFGDEKLREETDRIVHPAVKKLILSMIKEKEKNGYSFFFIEAALLIEDGYEEICDELWYVHADLLVRRERLKASRGYSDEKIDRIMAAQSSEEEFRRHCVFVIENNGDISETKRQIMEKIGGAVK